MASAFCIIEVSEIESWHESPRGTEIPAHRRPTILHWDRDLVEKEGKRLAEAHPDGHFAVFEVLLLARNVTIPAHVTLGGTVFESHRIAFVAEILNEEPPF
jgi:hypothetical protein